MPPPVQIARGRQRMWRNRSTLADGDACWKRCCPFVAPRTSTRARTHACTHALASLATRIPIHATRRARGKRTGLRSSASWGQLLSQSTSVVGGWVTLRAGLHAPAARHAGGARGARGASRRSRARGTALPGYKRRYMPRLPYGCAICGSVPASGRRIHAI